jgi:hypothetical protein
MIALGVLIAVSGITALRRPSEDTTTVGEAVIWRLTGAEPFPKSRFFKSFERVLHVLLTIFGCLLLLGGIGLLLPE